MRSLYVVTFQCRPCKEGEGSFSTGGAAWPCVRHACVYFVVFAFHRIVIMTPTAPPGLRAVVWACHAQRHWQIPVPERGDQDGLTQGTAATRRGWWIYPPPSSTHHLSPPPPRLPHPPPSLLPPFPQYFENPPESVKTRLLHLMVVWGRNLPDQPKIRDVRNMLQKQGTYTGPQGNTLPNFLLCCSLEGPSPQTQM